MKRGTMKPIYILIIILIVLALLIWLGLKIKSAPFPPFGQQSSPLKTMPLPSDLPAPVERFYKVTYGDQVPVITTAVVSGHGSMAPFGISFPLRFRFIYDVGKDYRAKIEATFFKQVVMGGDETYIDGHGIGKLTTGVSEGDWFDEAMNERIWAELLTWVPAALLSDSRVTWKEVDADTAMLIVPFGKKQQVIIVRFDPQSRKVQYVEMMKYRDAAHKILWVNAVWFDQGKPWVSLIVDDIVYNADVENAIRSKNK